MTNLDPSLDAIDYYTLLGVERNVTADKLKDAFRQFALQHHPDRHVGSSSDVAARAMETYRRGAEAYRVLSDHETRRLYDEGLANGQLRLQSDAPASIRRTSVAPTQVTRNPKASQFADNAMRAFKTGDLKNAKLNVKIALNHDPENPALLDLLKQIEEKTKAGR